MLGLLGIPPDHELDIILLIGGVIMSAVGLVVIRMYHRPNVGAVLALVGTVIGGTDAAKATMPYLNWTGASFIGGLLGAIMFALPADFGRNLGGRH